MGDPGRGRPGDRVSDACGKLERGRECCEQRAWADAYQALCFADQLVPLLEGEDLELLATSAYLIGRDDDYLQALDRAHQAYLKAGNGLRAIRCAFWLGLRLLFRGEAGRSTGWLSRAQRLLNSQQRDCVEHGYLLLPRVQEHLAAGDCEVAYATAADAA